MKLDELFQADVTGSEKEVTASMVLTDKHLNLMGKSHGGNQAYLCIRAMSESIGAPSTMLNFSISYLSPVSQGDVMTARAVVLHNGRLTAHTSAQVMAAGKLVATATGVFTKGSILDAPTIYNTKPRPASPAPYYLHDDDSVYAHSVKSILAMNDRKTMAALADQTKGSFCIAMRTTKTHLDDSGMVSSGLLPILTDISSGQAVASVIGRSVTITLSCTIVGKASPGDTLIAHGHVHTINGPLIHTQGEIYTEKNLIATTNSVFYHP